MHYKALILLIYSILHVNTIAACDCIMQPLASEIDRSEYIIEVSILHAFDTIRNDQNSTNTLAFAIAKLETVYKGKLQNGITIEFSPLERTNCDFSFEAGKKYLIFAYKDNVSFKVYKCSFQVS